MTASRWIAAIGMVILFAACGDTGIAPVDQGGDDGSDGGTTTGSDTTVAISDPDPDPSADTFCGLLGYPCTAAGVDVQVMERSEALLEDVRGRIDGGDTNDAVASWLRGRDGMADVSAGPSAIVFRLKGGEPTWFLTPPAEEAVPVDAGPPPSRSDIVGHETARDDAERTKKALILMPYVFQFGSNDPGPSIQAMLQGARDYSGGVDVVSNTVAPAKPGSGSSTGRPTVEDFKGWDYYDVIFVSTHGSEMTEDSFGCSLRKGEFFCIAGISTGQRVASCSAFIRANYPDTPGVRCAGTHGVPGTFLLLDTDFFQFEYGGLDKSIVYMSACQTYKNSSLAYELGGDRSEYFGWDESVYTAEAGAPAVRLFQLLIQDGLTTVDAFERLEDEGGTATTSANLRHYSNGDGLRIREITTMKNPMDPGVSGSASGPASTSPRLGPDADLRAGDVLPFLGQPGDGVNDELFLYVDVDGIEPGRESEYDLGLEVNDRTVGTWSLDTDQARRVGEYTVRLRIRQPLGFDVAKDQTIKLRATTNLPGEAEAESYHEATIRLANPTLHVHSTIESTGPDVHLVSEVEGDVDLRFEPGATPDELKVGPSDGSVRYVSFDATLPATSGCTQETSTVDGRLGILEATARFDDPESPAFGIPDDLVLIVYPEIDETLTVTCPAGPYSLDLHHWFSGFMSFHAGYFGGADEVDEARGGLVLTGWEPVSGGGTFARKAYQRSGEEGGVTYREDTTVEIRGPSYVATGAPSGGS